MSFKDILAPVLAVESDEAALAAAESVAEAMDAHVTALLLEPEPEPIYTLEGAMVSLVWADVLERARKAFTAEKTRLDQRAARGPRPITVRELEGPLGFMGRDAGVQARYADLTIMLRPGEEDLRMSLFEGALFGSGRPLLLVPPDWRKGAIGRNIVIAWNGKREAARAVAAPFLDRADKITIVTVSADKHEHAVSEVDGALAHLARRGLKAGVRVVGDLGFSETATLFAEAGADHADLVVMGGYGRSRLGEFVFGGVTREALKTGSIPVLMSH
jgi:nucleotide-binding universal stress UspA family protein